jgi:hypothetical protein
MILISCVCPFRINLDAPSQSPFTQKALVKCLPGVRWADACETAPARHRFPLPVGPANVEANLRSRRRSGGRSCHDERWRSIVTLSGFLLGSLVGRLCQGLAAECAHRGSLSGLGDARPETKPRARRASVVTTIDFRTDPVTARRHRLGRRRDGLLTRCGAEMLRAIGSSWSGLGRSGSSARRGDHARS